ncbi:secretin N-terminal domain-containing protein [Fibrobacterota bacterium]
MMRNKLLISICLGLVFCGRTEELRDIKFYNLEKEYSKTVTHVYKVKKAQALELKQIISGMLSIYGSLYVNEKTNELYLTDTEEKINDLRQVLPALDVSGIKAGNNLVSKLVYLKHENVSEVIGTIRHKLSPDGSVFEVLNLNALIITDVSSKIEEVEQTLQLIDAPNPQIAVEITVLEFNNEHFSKLGINVFNWLQGLSVGANVGSGGPGKAEANVALGSGTPQPISGGLDNKQSTTDGSGSLTSTITTDYGKRFYLGAQLNISDLVGFISENADGSVLANTRLITRNNKTASISAVERIPYRYAADEQSYESLGPSVVVAGTSVRVTPTLQSDSLINLSIIPSIANLTGWSPKGYPIVFERSINTEVKVKDNTIFVLGGLKKKESVEVRRGIPLLKDLPIIQYLFSVKQKVILDREVLIFIKPSTQISAAVSAESFNGLMKKYEEANK